MLFRARSRLVGLAALAATLLTSACAKNVKLKGMPMAGKGTASVKVQLTYDRNNVLLVKLSDVPEPSALNPSYTRYVLWAATPDRQHIINNGQLRVDEKKNAAISTLTPLRSFILFITAEENGDATSPGPDKIFEASRTDW